MPEIESFISESILLFIPSPGEATTSFLASNFINPLKEAKTKTWLHAMSGTMSTEGLTKDLESMIEAGIGGLTLFNIAQSIPEGKFAFFTELSNEAGLKCYINPYGFGPLNDLDVGGKSDLPMDEFWINRPITQTASTVSSAHIYGNPVISAAYFTSSPGINWKENPDMSKTSGQSADAFRSSVTRSDKDLSKKNIPLG